jgi:hypothetical protein
MAFILPTEQSSGVVAEYWKIMTVFVDCGIDRPASRTYLSLYLNQQARLDGKSPVSGTEVIMFLDEIDSTFSYDFRACIYNALKQRPEWANAVDAIDEIVVNEDPIPAPDPVILAPTANSFDINTQINTAAVVQSSASDPQHLPLNYSFVQAPTNGQLSVNSSGMFTYVPNQDYVGSDSAIYTVSNGTLSSDPANINITVGN